MSTELKPIRSSADYEQALAQLEELWGAGSGTPAGDRLDVLATLIDAYEAEHFPIDPPDPIEAIEFRMEQQGLSRKELMPMIGTRTRVAEVLNRKRGLSIGMIRRLHHGLGIPADILIRPSLASVARKVRRVPAGGTAGAATEKPSRTRARSAAEAPATPATLATGGRNRKARG